MRHDSLIRIAQGRRLKRLWPSLCLTLLLCGCASIPSLRAINSREAKIDVFPSGEIHVLGEAIAPKDLGKIVKQSDTKETDVILIRLHDDPDSPAMLAMRKLVAKQMILSGHSRYQFVTMPHASVTTYDKQTGRAETYTDPNPTKLLTGKDIREEIEQMEADAKAYKDGSYVSEAAERDPTERSDGRPEDLAIHPTYGGKQIKSGVSPQRSLKERWEKQQQRRYRR